MTDKIPAEFTVKEGLTRIVPALPGSVKFRMQNALESLERAKKIFEVDREIASFRAITGEEEAATALIKAIQLRGYEHAHEFNSRDHLHKAAVLACVNAIAITMQPMLAEFNLTFHFEKRRIDVKLPLSNFGVDGAADLAIQLVEPLGLLHAKTGIAEHSLYDGALAALAGKANFDNIRRMVSDVANARNRLLYASDSALPASNATMQDIHARENRCHTMLVLAIMVLQTREHLPMVRQAILAFLNVISRLPATQPNPTADQPA